MSDKPANNAGDAPSEGRDDLHEEIRGVRNDLAQLDTRFQERSRAIAAALTILASFGLYKLVVERPPLNSRDVAVFKDTNWEALQNLNSQVDQLAGLVLTEYENRMLRSLENLAFSGPTPEFRRAMSDFDLRQAKVPLLTGESRTQSFLAVYESLQAISQGDYERARTHLDSVEHDPHLTDRMRVVVQSLIGAVMMIDGPRYRRIPEAEQHFRTAIAAVPHERGSPLPLVGVSTNLLYEAEALAARADYGQALHLFQTAREYDKRAYELSFSDFARFRQLNNSSFNDAMLLSWYAQSQISYADVLDAAGFDNMHDLYFDTYARLDKAVSLRPDRPIAHETSAEFHAGMAAVRERMERDEGAGSDALDLYFAWDYRDLAVKALEQAIKGNLYDSRVAGSSTPARAALESLEEDPLLATVFASPPDRERIESLLQSHFAPPSQ